MDINNKKPNFQLTEKDDNGKILFNEDFYLIREYIAKQKIELGLKTYINVLGEVFFKSKNNMIDSNFATVRNDVHFFLEDNPYDAVVELDPKNCPKNFQELKDLFEKRSYYKNGKEKQNKNTDLGQTKSFQEFKKQQQEDLNSNNTVDAKKDKKGQGKAKGKDLNSNNIVDLEIEAEDIIDTENSN